MDLGCLDFHFRRIKYSLMLLRAVHVATTNIYILSLVKDIYRLVSYMLPSMPFFGIRVEL